MKNTAAVAGRDPSSRRVALQRVVADVAPVQILAKAEYANPGGSVKDRPALAMITDGERRGLLTRDKTIIDATSGNTGIAYAMLGARRGYRVKLIIPANASKERIATLKAYGAELVLSPPEESTDGQENHRGRAGSIFLSRSIQQPGQLAGALRNHRPGNLAPDRGTHHAFRRGGGHQRKFHGHLATA